MSIFLAAVVLLAVLGHAAIWVGLVNRWHATGFRRATVKSVTLLFYAAFIAIPSALVWRWFAGEPSWGEPAWLATAAKLYIALCALLAVALVPVWTLRNLRQHRLPAVVTRAGNHVVDMVQRLKGSPARGPRARILQQIPLNQIWKLHVLEYSLELPRLAAQHDGLSICHWSDFHFSGRIDRGYFDEIVRLTNSRRPDIIALTGDICDAARYIDWIVPALAAAEARLGKYFILGNHDLRTRDVPRLRAAMREAGFVDLGGRVELLAEQNILLAGDERPWIRAVPDLAAAVPAGNRQQMCNILLAHTPDSIHWARSSGFDLMLAGHTHGGQIHFPLVGPVVCPSWHGTKYAAGFFHLPPTLLHVSRGTASLFPVRIACPPELTTLVLRAPKERD